MGEVTVMETSSPDEFDFAMLEEAGRLLLSKRRQGYHSVAACVSTSSGDMFSALDLRSRKSPVCAEPCAISRAHGAGCFDLVRLCAVVLAADMRSTAVIAPCGACRELIAYQAPAATVLVQEHRRVRRVAAVDLFAFPDVPVEPYGRS